MRAQRCYAWELGRTGQVWVCAGPTESPLVTWLRQAGRTETCANDTGVDVPITLAAHVLLSAVSAEVKARSLLVRGAYARAWASVLAHECGAITIVHTLPESTRDSAPSTSTSIPTARTPTAADEAPKGIKISRRPHSG